MDRQFGGTSMFSIGGRGCNRNFHGKVASLITHSLVRNVLLPDSTEIELIFKDPIKWYDDYLDGTAGRRPDVSGTSHIYSLNSYNSARSTQI